MAEYINMITTSSVLATLFLGGWTLGKLDGILGAPFIWYGIKVAFFLFVFIWLRATLPRIRYDQLMRFGWQVLLPLSVLNALVTAAVIAFDLPWWVSGLAGLLILLIASAVYYLRLRARRRTTPIALGTADLDLVLPSSVRMATIDPSRPPVMPASTAEAVDADTTVATP
jgi:NADH-quinone oxidoreductase subunit H